MTIEGRNPVSEAIAAGTLIERIYISSSEGSIKKIIAAARERGISVQTIPHARLMAMAKTSAPQSIIAVVGEYRYCGVERLIADAEKKGEPPFLVLCDGITDPHNLGAIIRTANACGAHGVIIPKNSSVGVNETVIKCAAGAVSHTPIARVTNLFATIKELKAKNIWFYAAHQKGERLYSEVDYSGGRCIVVGSEGAGISRLVLENCDFLVKIPMMGEISSLNASVAAGIIMYESIKRGRED